GNLQDFKPQTGAAQLIATTGTVTINNVVINLTGSGSDIFVSMATPSVGTTGTHYMVIVNDATSFDIVSVDTAGATVTTDESVVSWAILS
ncbi:unnamed protein product, partial [marine sediment metagenome]